MEFAVFQLFAVVKIIELNFTRKFRRYEFNERFFILKQTYDIK